MAWPAPYVSEEGAGYGAHEHRAAGHEGVPTTNPQVRCVVPSSGEPGGARPILSREIPAIIMSRMMFVVVAIIRIIVGFTTTKRAFLVLRRRRRAPVLNLYDVQPDYVP
jgi:hypothetical protein